MNHSCGVYNKYVHVDDASIDEVAWDGLGVRNWGGGLSEHHAHRIIYAIENK